MRIAIIGSRTMAVAFRLGGVADVHEVGDGTEVDAGMARTRFRELIADEEVGMVIVSTSVAGTLRKDIDRYREQKRLVPLVVELPDETGEGEDRMAHVIRRAVGIDVTR